MKKNGKKGYTKNDDVDGTKRCNITVAVRCRPMNEKENSIRCEKIVEVISDRILVLKYPKIAQDDFLRVRRRREKRYTFDYAFCKQSSTLNVYNKTAKNLIAGVLDGYSATVFAYGATGAGKTFTMTGNQNSPGVMVLSLDDLFRLIKTRTDLKFSVSMSYVEIYNEHIRDLLTGVNESLDLRQHPLHGITIAGVKSVEGLRNGEEVFELLQQGNCRRTTEATDVNNQSSRSHAILTILVESKRINHEDGPHQRILVGKLSLIDLAGSERASMSNNRGTRLIEGANINRSLLALANCINALVKHKFVPYRDSKLTRLLKDSLGGNCTTIMITNTSPADFCYEDTQNSLKYANRVKNIRTIQKQTVAKIKDSEYSKIISNLRAEIRSLKGKLHNQQGGRSFFEVHNTLAVNQHREKMLDLFGSLVVGKKKILDLEEQEKHLLIKANNLVLSCRESGQSREKMELVKTEALIAEVQKKKNHLQGRLKASRRKVDNFRTQVLKKEETQIRTMLEVEFQMMLNQLEKIMEHERPIFHDILEQRNRMITKLEEQLLLRDKMLERQRAVLEEQKIPFDFTIPNQIVNIDELKGRDSSLSLDRAPPSPRRKFIPPKQKHYQNPGMMGGTNPILRRTKANEMNSNIMPGVMRTTAAQAKALYHQQAGLVNKSYRELRSQKLKDKQIFMHHGKMQKNVRTHAVKESVRVRRRNRDFKPAWQMMSNQERNNKRKHPESHGDIWRKKRVGPVVRTETKYAQIGRRNDAPFGRRAGRRAKGRAITPLKNKKPNLPHSTGKREEPGFSGNGAKKNLITPSKCPPVFSWSRLEELAKPKRITHRRRPRQNLRRLKKVRFGNGNR